MNRDEFVSKWATYLSGKFARFAYASADRKENLNVRLMVHEIESAVGRMYDELQARAASQVNGPPKQETVKK
jgi:hypothetical protein